MALQATYSDKSEFLDDSVYFEEHNENYKSVDSKPMLSSSFSNGGTGETSYPSKEGNKQQLAKLALSMSLYVEKIAIQLDLLHKETMVKIDSMDFERADAPTQTRLLNILNNKLLISLGERLLKGITNKGSEKGEESFGGDLLSAAGGMVRSYVTEAIDNFLHPSKKEPEHKEKGIQTPQSEIIRNDSSTLGPYTNEDVYKLLQELLAEQQNHHTQPQYNSSNNQPLRGIYEQMPQYQQQQMPQYQQQQMSQYQQQQMPQYQQQQMPQYQQQQMSQYQQQLMPQNQQQQIPLYQQQYQQLGQYQSPVPNYSNPYSQAPPQQYNQQQYGNNMVNYQYQQYTPQQNLASAPTPYLTSSKRADEFNQKNVSFQSKSIAHDQSASKILSPLPKCYSEVAKSLEEINDRLDQILNKIN